jgi:hypothetical protein
MKDKVEGIRSRAAVIAQEKDGVAVFLANLK